MAFRLIVRLEPRATDLLSSSCFYSWALKYVTLLPKQPLLTVWGGVGEWGVRTWGEVGVETYEMLIKQITFISGDMSRENVRGLIKKAAAEGMTNRASVYF